MGRYLGIPALDEKHFRTWAEGGAPCPELQEAQSHQAVPFSYLKQTHEEPESLSQCTLSQGQLCARLFQVQGREQGAGPGLQESI